MLGLCNSDFHVVYAPCRRVLHKANDHQDKDENGSNTRLVLFVVIARAFPRREPAFEVPIVLFPRLVITKELIDGRQ